MAEENYTARFRVDISDLKRGISDANKAIQRATAEFRNATAGMNDWTRSTDGLTAKIRQQQTVVEAEQRKLQLLREQQTRLNQAQTEGQRVVDTLTQRYNEAVATYGEASNEARDYARQLTQAQAAQERNASAAQTLETRILNQDAAVRNAQAEVQRYQNALNQLTQEQQDAANHTETLTEKVTRQQRELDTLKQRYADLVAQQGVNSTEARQLANQIENLSDELRDNRTRLQEAEDAADNLDHTLDDVGDSADNTANGGIIAFGVALGNLAATFIQNAINKMGELITQTIEVGKTFDSSMSNVAALSGATADELNMLRDTAKKYGSETQFSASQAADALGYMALAGWDANQSASALGGVLNLAAASNMDLAAASDMVTDYMSAFNMEAEDSAYFADLLAYAQANANTTAAGLGEAFKNSAANMNAAGQDIETTVSLLSMMANQGLKGSEAGTALAAVMRDMTAKMDSAAFSVESFTKYASELGLNTLELTDSLESVGISTEEFNDALSNSNGDIKAFIKQLNESADEGTDVAEVLNNLGYTTDTLGNIFGDITDKQKNFKIMVGDTAVAVTDANGNYRDMTDILKDVETATDGMGDAEKAAALASTFTSDSIRGLNLILNAGVDEAKNFEIELRGASVTLEGFEKAANESGVPIDDLKQRLEEAGVSSDSFATALDGAGGDAETFANILNDSVAKGYNVYDMMDDLGISLEDLQGAMDNSSGSADKMAKVMNDNLGGDVTALGSKLEGVQIAIYEKFEPALRSGVEVLSKLLDVVGFVVDHSTEFIAALAGMATAVGVYLAYTTALKVMEEGWAALTVVTKAQTAAQAALNFVTSLNPFAILIGAIAGLAVAFTILWKKSEKFRNFWIGLWKKIKTAALPIIEGISAWFAEAWDKIKTVWGAVSGWFGQLWTDISVKVEGFLTWFHEKWQALTTFFSTLWENIKTIFSTVAQWVSDNVFTPIINFFAPVVEFFKAAFEIIFQLAEGCWILIKTVWGLVKDWFTENVINPIVDYFTALWNTITTIAEVAWETIKGVWNVVSKWFKDHIITPVSTFFSTLWNAISTAATTAWNTIKLVWSAVSKWFSDHIIAPVSTAFSSIWDTIKKGAGDAWDGIKSVFSSVSDWFKDTFSKAWKKVKDVFSTGGKVFDGIKDGIVDAFKTVVNAIIGGINKVIAMPFNAINDILDTIEGISVAGIEPFEGLLGRLPVPQIPELAQGGILKKGQVGLLEGNGAEAVVPLEKNTGGLKKIADILLSNMNFPDIKGVIIEAADKVANAIKNIGLIPMPAESPMDVDYSKLANIARDIASEIKIIVQPPASSGPTKAGDTINNYNFNQTNTSPKALSRYDIYRQTRNLINAVKEV